MSPSKAFEAPPSILIIGTGVFGLSTAHALLSSPLYAHTTLTLLDAYVPPPTAAADAATATAAATHTDTPEAAQPLVATASTEAAQPIFGSIAANPLTGSLDSSRIVRADYANPAYAALAAEAQRSWRAGWPFVDGDGLGHGDGLVDDHGLVDGGHAPRSPRPPSTTRPDPPTVYHAAGLLVTANDAGNSNRRARQYVAASLANVQRLQGTGVRELADRAAIRTALYGGGAPSATAGGSPDGASLPDDTALGDFGYLNATSAWADASGALAGLRVRVAQLGAARAAAGHAAFRWVHGHAVRLTFAAAADRPVATGARLRDGSVRAAALTVVAAGAWSPALLPRSLGPRLRAAGQPVAYLRLREPERARLAGRPVLLNHGPGLYAIPPPADGRGPAANVLKGAQHCWGYSRKVALPDTEPATESASPSAAGPLDSSDSTTTRSHAPDKATKCTVSIPPSDTTHPIPPRSVAELSHFLGSLLPTARGRPLAATRLCWYGDTGSGDFLIDYVPRYGRSVLVVAGGSGHGFKFVPVIGERVVQRLEGRLGVGVRVEEEQEVEVEEQEAQGQVHGEQKQHLEVEKEQEAQGQVHSEQKQHSEANKARDTQRQVHSEQKQRSKAKKARDTQTQAPGEKAAHREVPNKANGATNLEAQLAHLWRWRTDAEVAADWADPGDGSRGGVPGLVWADEMAGVEGWEEPVEVW